MAERFTPLIGLAVVVALAFAVVIGAVGLTNPAFAGGEPVVNVDGDTFRGQVSTTPTLTVVGGSSQVTLTYALNGFTTTEAAPVWAYRFGETDTGNVNAFTEAAAATGSSADLDVDVTSLVNGVEYRFQAIMQVSTGDATEIPGSRTSFVLATPNAPPVAVTDLSQTPGPGTMTLKWSWAQGAGSAVTKWQYLSEAPGPLIDWQDMTDSAGDPIPASAREFTITGLNSGTQYRYRVRPVAGSVPATSAGPLPTGMDSSPTHPSAFTKGSATPGSNTWYRVNFSPSQAFTSGEDELTIELTDFDVPTSISTDDISIRLVKNICGAATSSPCDALNPDDVSVSGEKIRLTLPDLDGDDDPPKTGIAAGDVVVVTIRQAAGVRNPSEGGNYDEIEVTGIDALDTDIDLVVELSEEDGSRGDMVTATGKGFKNGTTLTFYLDSNKNGTRDQTEFDLCAVTVSSADIGECTFEITNPPFQRGDNFVNAVDGRNNKASTIEDDDQKFELKSSITATPAGGRPGDTIQVQLTDFAPGAITVVQLARRDVTGAPKPTVPGTGDLNFRITIPDWAPEGQQDLLVESANDDANTTVTITGPVIQATPSSVVPNQKVNLVGTGFTAGETIETIAIGGQSINSSRINGNKDVDVDNGGNWSASVDLPLDSSTTAEGSQTVRVTDSAERSGTFELNFPARLVTITPETSRVGTLAVVRGENFPSKNDDGSSFNVVITYTADNNSETTVTATPDASGRFEAELRIPTGAGIPSTNTVKVTFEDDNDVSVVTTVTHSVPEGAISLSASSGPAGTQVSVSGQGFKAFVPVQEVNVGSIEVTPSPAPSTDAQGALEFDITVPGLDNGIQTIEVRVSGTTASIGFTVTPSGISAGDITPAAEAVENLGDAFVSSFHFNNDNKEWTFYSPAAGDSSSQENFIAGETYWIRVSATTEAILNGETRNLTCVAGDCWNQIVW